MVDPSARIPNPEFNRLASEEQVTRTAQALEVNGLHTIIVDTGDRVLVVMTIEVEASRVKTVRFIANPDKLAHLQ